MNTAETTPLSEAAYIEAITEVLPAGFREKASDDAWFDPVTRHIYTADMLVEGVHFSRDYYSAADIGWKAAAVNISDIAATGGSLQYLLVSVGIGANMDKTFVQELYKGLQEAASAYSGVIIGGDTVSAPQLVLNVTAVGLLPENHVLGQRSGAKPGHYVVTTGYLGLSANGLRCLQANLQVDSQNTKPVSVQSHLHPVPKIEAGLTISAACRDYALMDTSDGLGDGLLKIAQASGVAIEVEQEKLPVHDELLELTPEEQLNCVLYGGEDFELLATVPAVDDELLKHFRVIGNVREGHGVTIMDANGTLVHTVNADKTFQHFKAESNLNLNLKRDAQ